MPRNTHVEETVAVILESVDSFVAGRRVEIPDAKSRRICDDQLSHRAGSVRLASLFLAHYCLRDKLWDCESVPTGIRGKYGDKLLANELNRRNITLHDAITAFGENLGWKGNVGSVRLSRDPRFSAFAAHLQGAGEERRLQIAMYLAYRFAESQRTVRPIPPVGDDVLTFARAKELVGMLSALATEGHVQQFLVAALLTVHRRRFGLEVRTHHPHAADKFDKTAGDIEEVHDGHVIAAYEVTVRSDWKNRDFGFRSKNGRKQSVEVRNFCIRC